jgi:hypothetical protein
MLNGSLGQTTPSFAQPLPLGLAQQSGSAKSGREDLSPAALVTWTEHAGAGALSLATDENCNASGMSEPDLNAEAHPNTTHVSAPAPAPAPAPATSFNVGDINMDEMDADEILALFAMTLAEDDHQGSVDFGSASGSTGVGSGVGVGVGMGTGTDTNGSGMSPPDA